MNNTRTMHGPANLSSFSHLRLGNFSKLFPELSTWADDFGIEKQAEAVQIAKKLGGPKGIMHDVNDCSGDSTIPAAYTFFAQFVDHDITLDAGSDLRGTVLTNEEIEQLPNFRSASLDLDSVYGFGPAVSPHLYDSNQQARLLVGSNVDGVENPADVPRRMTSQALLGDPRNDENLFLSQMHLLFLRFHNRRIIDLVISRNFDCRFEDVQRDVRYHYQYIVLHDFLKQVCDGAVYNHACEQIEARNRSFFILTPDEGGRLPMPVEFSGAAYRFGHSMVRSQYPVNQNYPSIEIFDERFGTTGFTQVPPELTVDWQFLLDVNPAQCYVNSKAIDHLLADELIALPIPVVMAGSSVNEHALAFRNLLRGYVLGLPSGQRIAQALAGRGYPGIPEDGTLEFGETLENVCDDCKETLKKHTPLFFYLMHEAGTEGCGNRLGPVGSAILMEVFGAMLLHSETSFLKEKAWKPDASIVADSERGLTLADLVRYVSA